MINMWTDLRHRFAQPVLLAFLCCSMLLATACNNSSPTKNTVSPSPTPVSLPVYDFPAVDANYAYDQLYYMSMTFLQRESGFDTAEQNGHKAFAQYWANEMLNNLRGLGARVSYDNFQAGWISRPGVSPSYNVEVTIPGAVHPEQVVVVGSHYDGMHVSQGSAFDDTSGCAIMLAETRALGNYWRSHHLYPARTLRFVIFDAEEEGILGSYQYANNSVNGDLTNIVAMFNEEQSGLSYPVRFLGKASNPLIPLRIANLNTSASHPFFSDLLSSAVSAVAQELRTMGYTSLTYHGDNGRDISQPIFTSDQLKQAVSQGDELGFSDDAAFDQAMIPALTFIAGDEGDVNNGRQHNPNNIPDNEYYPFDTHYDTIQLLNGYASGATGKSPALALALDFQAMIQAWMFDQPGLVGTLATNQLAAGPLAAISDIGISKPGVPLKLDASSSFDPFAPRNSLNYRWDFGDGTRADGVSVQHTYAHAGKYILTLTVQDARGTRKVSKTLVINAKPPTYGNTFLGILQQEAASGSPLARGDLSPGPGFRLPSIVQNGDGLTGDDHFPGHNPEPTPAL